MRRVLLLALGGFVLVSCGNDARPSLTFPEGDPRAMYLEQENHIADCMEEAGFQYIPFLRPNEDPGSGPVVDIDVGEDPNIAIYDSLSPDERARYDEALYGSADFEDGSFGGCNRRAFVETYGFGPEELHFEIDDSVIAERDAFADADPRVVAALGDYQSCMKEKGFDVESPYTYLDQNLQALEAMDAQAVEAGVSAEELEGYSELQAYQELLIAADQECSPLYLPVRAEVELEWYNEHLAYLPMFGEDE